MTRCDVRWLRRFLLAGLGLAVAGACSTPEYDFVPDPTVEHCANEFFDAELGETDTDCGGSDCSACDLGQGCIETSDCVEGQCVDNFCQAAGCANGALDEGETAIDCGGSCKPCQTGEGCLVAADCASRVCTNDSCAAPTCDDDVINGTETGRDCGGGLCDGCGTGSPCNEPTDCRSGVCSGEVGTKKCDVSCPANTAECDGDTALECETNLLTDPMHCGDCATVCELANTEQSCVSGTCQIGGCNDNYDDCNNDVEDGCETNLRNDAGHCGSCGMECSDDNGTPSCVASECQIACDDGFEDCDDDRSNGCERSVASDVEACGDCTTICPIVPGETPWCRDGICGGTPCPDGLGNCDGMGDSCEQDLTSDIDNCGRCGGVCTVRNGTPRCEAEACAVQSCEDGWDNCDDAAADGGYANGCETNTNVDVANCGACGNDCTVSHGSATCVNGECRVMSCDTGWFNCDSGGSDGGYANGCETNTAADKLNCGACGTNCDTVLASSNATGRCVSGLCQRDQCLPNFGDCDSNAMNCESDFRTDEGDCGNCDTACVPTGTTGSPGNVCMSGTCTPNCDATHANCDLMGPNGCEINKSNNVAHCGGCNMACSGGRPCINSMCGCSGGLTLCDDSCVNTTSDSQNCGTCDNVCTGGRTCTGSVCQCPAGQTFCGSTCVNMQTDEMNCGVCGRVCDTPAGTTSNTCTGGACVPVCDTLRGSCDMEPWDGCEVNFASNNTHCGACNRACQTGSSAHVSANTCSSGGVCQPTCAAGWDNCDSEPWDGCEANITGPDFCGACGVTCSGLTPTCVASGSARTCQATIAQIGTPVSDGVQGATLPTLMHNLTVATGQNRLVVVGVVARATTGGITQARPDLVTYNGTAMSVGPEFDGGPPPGTDGQSHVFFYYLNNAALPTTTGNKAVVVDAAPGAQDPTVLTAMAVAFTGVRQTTPLTAQIGATFGNCSMMQPSSSVTVATTGSVILSMSGAQYSGTASPTGSLSVLMDNETSNDSQMRAVGGVRGLSAQLTPGSYPVGWSYSFCNNSVHFAVVVHPATSP